MRSALSVMRRAATWYFNEIQKKGQRQQTICRLIGSSFFAILWPKITSGGQVRHTSGHKPVDAEKVCLYNGPTALTVAHAPLAVTPRCGGKRGKRPMTVHCSTQCSNGCSLGSFLLPRQQNHGQRCTYHHDAVNHPCPLWVSLVNDVIQ